MSVADQKVTEKYAVYNSDCMEVISKLPTAKIHLSLYSPPFVGIYRYSSDERDFSNCSKYAEFMQQYGFLVAELARVTMPGRMTVVHCMDIPSGNTGSDHMLDFPGDIIRLHEQHGWRYVARYAIWKEPFAVYLRTMQKNLRHCTVVEDSSNVANAAADYLLVFRRSGKNEIPIAHPIGLTDYAGDTPIPKELLKYKGWTGKQTENRYSQWVWRQYAASIWNDVRLDRVLPYQECKEPDDEKHVHPLQLDVIERAVILWSNPGEVVLTPFMGVGSEVYGAVLNGRRAIGIELKASYYRQAIKNLDEAARGDKTQVQTSMFTGSDKDKTSWLDGVDSDNEEKDPS